MRKWLYLVIIALLSISVIADTERKTLLIGQSFNFDGRNITLVDSSEDSVIICVNGVKAIVSDEKTVNGVLIELINSEETDARFLFDYDCDEDCLCDGNECNNNACFRSISAETIASTTSVGEISGETSIEEETIIGEETTNTIEEQEEDGEVEWVDTEMIKKFSYILIGVAVVLGIAAYSRRGKEPSVDELEKEEIDF